MRLHSCKRCGKEYETDRPGTYLCPACSSAARKSASIRPRTCRQCGASFFGGPRAWYCPACRTERKRAAEKRRKAHGSARPLGSTDLCRRCGKSYVVEGSRQTYCKACADIAVTEAVRRRKREYAQANRDAMNAHKQAMRADRKICVVCGKKFNPKTVSVTCSPECASAHKKINQKISDFRRGKRKTAPDVPYVSGLPKSGIVGVTARRNGKWQASYKGHYLGIFDTIPEAASAIETYKEEITHDK